jgi:hypothetical protein
VNQHGLNLMTDEAVRLNHPLVPLLRGAYSLCISYANGMSPGPLDKQLGGEAALALRLLYRAFAESDELDFTGWVNRFDVSPRQLTLSVAIAALRTAHKEKVPAGQVALLYIGVDEFNGLCKVEPTLLDSVVSCIGKAMSSPPPDCFVVGMLTGTASQALSDSFDSSRHEAVRLSARLLTLEEVEVIVEKVPSIAAANWRGSKAFRRCLAGTIDTDEKSSVVQG